MNEILAGIYQHLPEEDKKAFRIAGDSTAAYLSRHIPHQSASYLANTLTGIAAAVHSGLQTTSKLMEEVAALKERVAELETLRDTHRPDKVHRRGGKQGQSVLPTDEAHEASAGGQATDGSS